MKKIITFLLMLVLAMPVLAGKKKRGSSKRKKLRVSQEYQKNHIYSLSLNPVKSFAVTFAAASVCCSGQYFWNTLTVNPTTWAPHCGKECTEKLINISLQNDIAFLEGTANLYAFLEWFSESLQRERGKVLKNDSPVVSVDIVNEKLTYNHCWTKEGHLYCSCDLDLSYEFIVLPNFFLI